MWIYFYYQVHPQYMSLPRSQQKEFSVGKHMSEGTQKDLDITCVCLLVSGTNPI